MTGEPTLGFALTREGQQVFLRGTAASVGKKVATMIDGVIMSAPVVNSAIKGGRFSLNVPSQAAADALLAKLRCVN